MGSVRIVRIVVSLMVGFGGAAAADHYGAPPLLGAWLAGVPFIGGYVLGRLEATDG